MISVEGISKRFHRVQALKEVSFRVGRGEVVGFLGPNGAGKTTMLRIIAGFLAADRGRVRVDDIDVGDDPRAAQRRIGYLPEGAPLYDEMRVVDFLAYRARLKSTSRARIAPALASARASEAAGRRIGQLSRGWRQRIGLADALLADPPILVLDEPTAGLDPNQIREIRTVITELARERTVLLSSHLLSEVEALSARVVILNGGSVVAEGRVSDLRSAGARSQVVVRPGDLPAALSALAAVSPPGTAPTVEVIDAASGRAVVGLPPAECARRLVAAGIDVVEVAAERTLEEVFRRLTDPSPTDASPTEPSPSDPSPTDPKLTGGS